MYFPKDMNFQYFFFGTYIGYFLQALPIALMAGLIYGAIRFRKDKETPVSTVGQSVIRFQILAFNE